MNTENDIKMKELAEHFQQEQPHLMRYACYRLGDTDDAKDALQDAFLKISSKFSDEKSVEVRDWRNYIFRVLSNLCSSRHTALGKLRTIPLDARLDIGIELGKCHSRIRFSCRIGVLHVEMIGQFFAFTTKSLISCAVSLTSSGAMSL